LPYSTKIDSTYGRKTEYPTTTQSYPVNLSPSVVTVPVPVALLVPSRPPLTPQQPSAPAYVPPAMTRAPTRVPAPRTQARPPAPRTPPRPATQRQQAPRPYATRPQARPAVPKPTKSQAPKGSALRSGARPAKPIQQRPY